MPYRVECSSITSSICFSKYLRKFPIYMVSGFVWIFLYQIWLFPVFFNQARRKGQCFIVFTSRKLFWPSPFQARSLQKFCDFVLPHEHYSSAKQCCGISSEDFNQPRVFYSDFKLKYCLYFGCTVLETSTVSIFFHLRSGLHIEFPESLEK